MAWGDIAGSPWFQLGYPLATALGSMASPGLARGIYGMNAGLGLVNRIQEQQREQQQQQAGGERLKQLFSAEKFVTPQIEGAQPRGGTFTPQQVAQTPMLQAPEPETGIGMADPDMALSATPPVPAISPNIAAPINKQPMFSPQMRGLGEALIASGDLPRAGKLAEEIVNPPKEKPHYFDIAQRGGGGRGYMITPGEAQATAVTPEPTGTALPTSGDALYVQAAQTKFPNDPQAQAAEVQKLRNNPQGYMNRIFADALEQSGGDTNEAIKRVQDVMKQTSQQRATGTAQGQLDIRSTPEYKNLEQELARLKGFGGAVGTTAGQPLPPAAQHDIAGLEGALRQIGNIRGNVSAEYLGPVRGSETAFSTRRQIGNYIGSPLGEKETTFRQSLADVADQLLRARSGAQINEAEYARLKGMLPKATDEPQVFEAGLKRFETELNAMATRKRELATTPRGQPGGTPAAPAPGGKPRPGGIPKVISVERLSD